MGARKFTDLRVYNEALDLCVEIYRRTAGYPREEQWGLVLQMRRAASSIGANIAEGFGRWSRKDQARFYEIAKGSADELRHFIILSGRLGFLKPDPALDASVDGLCGGIFKLRQVVLSGPPRG